MHAFDEVLGRIDQLPRFVLIDVRVPEGRGLENRDHAARNGVALRGNAGDLLLERGAGRITAPLEPARSGEASCRAFSRVEDKASVAWYALYAPARWLVVAVVVRTNGSALTRSRGNRMTAQGRPIYEDRPPVS